MLRPRLPALTARRLTRRSQPCWFSARGCANPSAPVAASVLVRGEQDAEKAAAKVADALTSKLGSNASTLTIFFAKGYGGRAQGMGAVLKQRMGSDAVIVGSSSEAGLIGDGSEVQNEKFALSGFAIQTAGLRVFPFHSTSLNMLPELGRGGSWSTLQDSPVPPCVLAFCALPMHPGADPQGWCKLLDRALLPAGSTAKSSRLPTVIGGLTVGHFIHVDGEEYTGGAFGVAMSAIEEGGPTFEAVVCQGAVPFGPKLTITGVLNDHTISELDGKKPKDVLMPLLNGPSVPGTGSTMAGIFVEAASTLDPSSISSSLGGGLSAPLSGRPSCIVRPLHAFTPEGDLVLSPITDDLAYAEGMQIQMHCMNKDLALEDLRMRAGHDVMAHNFAAPDAAVIIACGARGVQLYDEEGVESQTLRAAWGRDVPTIGFFAGGEIGPVGCKTYMHGFTTSCLMIRMAQ